MAIVVAAMIAAGCSSSEPESDTIRLITHDGFHIPEDAIAEFTERTGIEVIIFREENPTAVVDLLSRSRTSAIADVVVGIDTLDRQRVIDERLVEPYRPIARETLTEEFLVDNDWLTPVSYLDACLNRSVSYFLPPSRPIDELPDPDESPPPVPQSFDDLLDPVHAPTLVIPDARTSRMGLYFLVALAQQYPEGRGAESLAWPQYLDQLVRQGALVTESWEEAYFTHFLPGSDTTFDAEDPTALTERPITWGSAGMPSVTVRFQPDLPEDVDIEVMRSGCIRIVNYAGIVTGTENRLNAGRLLDTMVEPLFQFGIPDRFGSRPARPDIVRTEAWREFGVELDGDVLDPRTVGERWPEWQLTWNQILTDIEDGAEVIEPLTTVTLPS